jgi:hypothetical protein
MLPKRRVRRHVLSRPIFRVRWRPTLWRQLSGFKGVLDPTKPFLIHLLEQVWKPLLGFLPFPLWDLKPDACSRLDLGSREQSNPYHGKSRIRVLSNDQITVE